MEVQISSEDLSVTVFYVKYPDVINQLTGHVEMIVIKASSILIMLLVITKFKYK